MDGTGMDSVENLHRCLEELRKERKWTAIGVTTPSCSQPARDHRWNGPRGLPARDRSRLLGTAALFPGCRSLVDHSIRLSFPSEQ